MLRPTFITAFVSLGLTALASSALAQGMGLEGLHDHRREGGKVCMVDHFHDGSGNGKSRKAAEADAARSWSEFTAWEYGGRWGSFGNAANKTMNCSTSGGSWSCQVSARPCRAGR